VMTTGRAASMQPSKSRSRQEYTVVRRTTFSAKRSTRPSSPSPAPSCLLNCGDALDPHAGAQGAAELARNHGKTAPEDHANAISLGRVEVDPGHARPADAPEDPSLTVSAMPASDRPHSRRSPIRNSY
jgi:hypothetical protein